MLGLIDFMIDIVGIVFWLLVIFAVIGTVYNEVLDITKDCINDFIKKYNEEQIKADNKDKRLQELNKILKIAR